MALFTNLMWLGAGCRGKEKADTLIVYATVYTVDSNFSTAEAVAIRDGKILKVGSSEELLKTFEARNVVNASGQFVYPGFIDAHAHFLLYGQSRQQVDLVGTKSWEEVVEKVKAFAHDHPDGWLIGRGWDQNDWTNKEFPNRQLLDQYFPDRPVLLERVDGHAAIVNQKALDLARISSKTKVDGGDILSTEGKATGILVDNAIELVNHVIPKPDNKQLSRALLLAQEHCFSAGLTTVDECGINYETVDLIRDMQKDSLKIRLYVMLADHPKNYNYLLKSGPIISDRLTVRAFKLYGDGALGSRGACLLQPYQDRPLWQGFLLSPEKHFDSIARILSERGLQMCTHAIGDSANRLILNVYARHLKGKNDKRWRIEHAQVVHPDDFELFGRYNIIPSVQPTHATSDMYWAGERLGKKREEGAYAYQMLLQQNGWLPLGTDFPVEAISPLKTFYAAVVRKDTAGKPEKGYQMTNALSRQQALRGITIWAARANFEEQKKGSLEVGKFADLVILDGDLMTAPGDQLFRLKVISTYLQGEKVYQKTRQ